MKTILNNMISLVLMLLIGLGIYYFLLKPEPANQNHKSVVQASTTEFYQSALFDQNGTLIKLADLKGKTVIVNFWATWCPPCREEMPDLSDIHTQYHDQNLTVIGLAIDDAVAVKTYSKDSPVSYPLVIAENEGMELSTQLGNQKGVLPYTAIINPKGVVTHTFYGKVNQSMLVAALPKP